MTSERAELVEQLRDRAGHARREGNCTAQCDARMFDKAADFIESQAVAGEAVIADVLREVGRATDKFPTWPTDPLHAVAVLNEEVGELNKAVLQCTYEPHKSGPQEVREEAIQATAMAIRFLMSLDRYVYTPGEQHSQGPALAAQQQERS